MPTPSFLERYGPWALITGAAREEGLGFGFAEALAAQGFRLVLVDIQENLLQKRAEQLTRRYDVECRLVPLDLGRTDFPGELQKQTQDLTLGLVICNHMYMPNRFPTFLETDLEESLRVLDINARAYTSLMHTYAHHFRTLGRGGLIVVSSGSAYFGTGQTATYSANKAYQLILTEALWAETQHEPWDILAVTPGLVGTGTPNVRNFPQWMMTDVSTVVKDSLRALGRRHLVVPSLKNRILFWLQQRLMPRRMAVQTMLRTMQGARNKAQSDSNKT